MKKYGEIISGAAVFLVAAIYYTMAFGIKQFGAGQPGIVTSDFMPKIYGAAVMVLSAIQMLRGMKDLKAVRNPGEKEEKESQAAIETRKWPVEPEILLTFLLLIIYVALLRSVGFIIMSILFILGLSCILLPTEKHSPKTYFLIFIAGAAFTVAITLIFVQGFHLTLPMGILG